MKTIIKIEITINTMVSTNLTNIEIIAPLIQSWHQSINSYVREAQPSTSVRKDEKR